MNKLNTFKQSADGSRIVVPEARRGGTATVIKIGKSEKDARLPDSEDGNTYLDFVMNKLSTDENYRYLAARLKDIKLQADQRMDALKDAIDGGDAEDVAISARELTDYVGRVGAIRMMRMCIAMQMLGRRGMLEKARSLMSDIEMEYSRVKDGHVRAAS